MKSSTGAFSLMLLIVSERRNPEEPEDVRRWFRGIAIPLPPVIVVGACSRAGERVPDGALDRPPPIVWKG